jgi:hypothetical protein
VSRLRLRPRSVAAIVLLVLIALIIVANIAVTRHERDQALLANIAARQRTLVERYAKDVLLVSRGVKADPDSGHEVLQETIHALIAGGDVSDLQGSSHLQIPSRRRPTPVFG